VQIPNREKAIRPVLPPVSEEKSGITEVTEATEKIDLNKEAEPSTKI
jgi:hypothetical protein